VLVNAFRAFVFALEDKLVEISGDNSTGLCQLWEKVDFDGLAPHISSLGQLPESQYCASLLEERKRQPERQISAVQSALAMALTRVDRVEANFARLASDGVEAFRLQQTDNASRASQPSATGARIPLHRRRQPSASQPGKGCSWIR
jgi:hypothetical protein